MSEEKKIQQVIRQASKFHGHLGAFLVIGVRMGRLAQELLRKPLSEPLILRTTLKVPLEVPYSCTIDGIQLTTHCTVGNRRLSLEDSREQILGRFTVKGSDQILTVSVNPEVVNDLLNMRKQGVSNEQLAEHVSVMPIKQLFTVKK
jgi:formylmethanofuran dehydrogenase subunit E